jgi:hypothetical protein
MTFLPSLPAFYHKRKIKQEKKIFRKLFLEKNKTMCKTYYFPQIIAFPMETNS